MALIVFTGYSCFIACTRQIFRPVSLLDFLNRIEIEFYLNHLNKLTGLKA